MSGRVQSRLAKLEQETPGERCPRCGGWPSRDPRHNYRGILVLRETYDPVTGAHTGYADDDTGQPHPGPGQVQTCTHCGLGPGVVVISLVAREPDEQLRVRAEQGQRQRAERERH